MSPSGGVDGERPLVGAWRLVSWENRAADGRVSYPMGADAHGYLIYTADRRFSVTISRTDRAGFTGGDLLGGTVQEKAEAVEGFVAYAGWYTFDGDHVVHHVELSLFSQLGRHRSAAVRGAVSGHVNPQRQPPVNGRQVAGPASGLGASPRTVTVSDHYKERQRRAVVSWGCDAVMESSLKGRSRSSPLWVS
jgi:hypothetical protein